MTGSQAVLTVIWAAALAATGCARTVDGAAVAAETPNHTMMTTATGRAPGTVPIAVLDSLLLTQQQIVALVGGTNMALVVAANSTSDASKLIDDRTCLGLGSIGDVTTYSNSGYVGMRGNHSYFDTQDLRGSGSRIELSMRREEDPRWGCSHAMAVQNNVVIEARVCLLGKDTAAAVNNLLDQVVARIPQ